MLKTVTLVMQHVRPSHAEELTLLADGSLLQFRQDSSNVELPGSRRGDPLQACDKPKCCKPLGC